ncbi:MAG TPA: GNAT family N-acetyltransferase [Pseudonocardiaceae bacterium]|nr:GNAT family N-acetyltransferase [Pseudonocardiaceae bacterium]
MIDFVSVALDESHVLDGFDCGVPSLNSWLVNEARRAKASGTANTYVATRTGDDRVVAYYAITPHRLARDEVTGGMAGGVSQIPGYLLGRLALDQSLHGQGLGGQLLRDALERIVEAANVASGRLIVVDAIDGPAVAFYQKYGFQPTKIDPHRLVMKVATARKNLT